MNILKCRRCIVALVLSWLCASLVFSQSQSKQPGKVTRAKRPQFTERDWDGIYFRDLFREGLVGPRPADLGNAAKSTASASPSPATNDSLPASSAGAKWSGLVSASVLEDEIKRLQSQLSSEVTVPAQFKSGMNRKVRQTYSILAMLFGIINEYDMDVRWKKHAPAATLAFARVAAGARSATDQAYQAAKSRMAELQEMVRGGNFPEGESLGDDYDWSSIVDRGPIMERMEAAYQERLRPLSASESQFHGNAENILHEAELMAAMARVLSLKGMDDADDDGYRSLAESASGAARDVAAAVRNNDFASVARSVNLIDQACNNCHDQWR